MFPQIDAADDTGEALPGEAGENRFFGGVALPAREDNDGGGRRGHDRHAIPLLERWMLPLEMERQGVGDGIDARKEEREDPENDKKDPEVAEMGSETRHLRPERLARLPARQADEDDAEKNEFQRHGHRIQVDREQLLD